MKKLLSKGIEKIKILNSTNNELPIVISIAHSGQYLTANMYDNLKKDIILPNMDWYLPELYSFFEEQGFTTIINNISRYVIDPNRRLEEECIDDSYINTFIYTKTTFGKEMYKKDIDIEEINYRINEFYVPYHQAIEKALKEKLKHFKKVYLIDLHSFGKEINSDIILGNDEGKTTSGIFIEFIKSLLEKQDFAVNCNEQYKGGYITKHYSKKIEGCEALQIELSYQTYIDERKFGEEEFPSINKIVFKKTQSRMRKCFIELKQVLLEQYKTE